jgi:hypothetical protein
LGYILGDFLTNSSGHPAQQLERDLKSRLESGVFETAKTSSLLFAIHHNYIIVSLRLNSSERFLYSCKFVMIFVPITYVEKKRPLKNKKTNKTFAIVQIAKKKFGAQFFIASKHCRQTIPLRTKQQRLTQKIVFTFFGLFTFGEKFVLGGNPFDTAAIPDQQFFGYCIQKRKGQVSDIHNVMDDSYFVSNMYWYTAVFGDSQHSNRSSIRLGQERLG